MIANNCQNEAGSCRNFARSWPTRYTEWTDGYGGCYHLENLLKSYSPPPSLSTFRAETAKTKGQGVCVDQLCSGLWSSCRAKPSQASAAKKPYISTFSHVLRVRAPHSPTRCLARSSSSHVAVTTRLCPLPTNRVCRRHIGQDLLGGLNFWGLVLLTSPIARHVGRRPKQPFCPQITQMGSIRIHVPIQSF